MQGPPPFYAAHKPLIFGMLLLWAAPVAVVKGQSLLDPNLTTDQLIRRQGAGPGIFSPQAGGLPGSIGTVPPPAPATLANRPPPSPPSAEEIAIQKEISDFVTREGMGRNTPPERMAVLSPQLIALYEKGYEKNVELHREDHPIALFWTDSLLMFHAESDCNQACKYGLLTLSWLKKAMQRDFGVPDDSPSPGIMVSLVQGQVLDLLCQTKDWEKATHHAKQCQPFFESSTEEEKIERLGPTAQHLLCHRYHQGLMGFGRYYEHQGDLPAAIRWFTHAQDFAKKNLGRMAPYAKSLSRLAGVYAQIRDYQREEPLRVEALEIYRQLQGDVGYQALNAMGNLAWNYNKQGRYNQAEAMFRDTLSLAKKSPFLSDGAGPLLISDIQNSLADVLQRSGKSAEASRLFDESTAALMRAKPEQFAGGGGSKELDVALQRINNGIHLFHYARKPKEAEGTLLQAISFLETQTSPDCLDFLDRARRTVASAQWQQDKKDAARESASKWMHGYDARLEFILRFTTEDQRLSWMDWQTPFDLAASFGMAGDAAHLLLRTKGIVLDSILEDRVIAQKAAGGQAASDWDALRKTRDELRQAWAAKDPDLAAITRLEAQKTALETRMAGARTSTATLRDSLNATVAQVQDSIPGNGALLDYFRFYGPDASGQMAERYAVVLLRNEGKPELAILPWTAAQLDDALHVFRNVMRRPEGLPKAKDGDLQILMKTLHSGFVAPAEGRLKSVRTLIISSDSELNFLPFAALVDAEGKFLCERFDIRQINSARDLVARPENGREPAKKIALYGNAQYRLDQTPGPVVARHEGRLAPLPGTKREIEAVSRHAQAAGWTVELAQGVQASEGNVRAIQGPGILHLATHGFFMPRSLPAQAENTLNLAKVEGRPQRLRTQFDPMNRSGILLAGAQNSLEQWSKGISFPLADDGVLTAAEAGNLDLRHTWLVVLSACDTGMGDSVSGEGVMGLRRAFLYAGARNVMMSLWPIRDEATADFIDDFYAKALATGDAATALSETQRSWLVRLKREETLYEAIKRGGAFILVGSGR